MSKPLTLAAAKKRAQTGEHTVYFVIPVAIAVRLMRTKIAQNDAFDFGEPIVERAGVTNPARRAAFAHAFTGDQIAKIDAKRASEGASGQVFFDGLPDDWRYPLTP